MQIDIQPTGNTMTADNQNVTGRPANAEMIEGFRDGYDLNAPEPSANRSHSYRHGFANGRDDVLHKRPRDTFENITKQAERAMAADENRSQSLNEEQMTEKTIEVSGESFKALEKHIGDTPIAPAHGVAALALDMSIKYHDIATVQDGTLYQQYKLEGRNLQPLHLDMVFETAIKMEMYLLGASDRIAKVIVDALVVSVEDDEVSTKSEAD